MSSRSNSAWVRRRISSWSTKPKRVQRLAADPDVLGHRHVVHQVELLMDHGDAVLERVERRGQLDLLALQPEGAGVGRVDAGDDLHQRRLAGAVLAHQRVDVAALQAERHVVERQHAGEGLADALDFEQVFGAGDGAALPDDLGGRRTDGRHGAPSRLFRRRPAFRGPAPTLSRFSPREGRRRAGRTARLRCRPGAPSATASGVPRQFFLVYLSMLAGVTSWKGM